MTLALPFPGKLPAGYNWLTDEPTFDPERHLALEVPARITSLTDLGYAESEVSNKATAIAASTPFRILSDEGVAVMQAVALRLQVFTRPAGERIERTVCAGCYRSRWLSDFCVSVDVTEHLAKIYAIPVAPHPMALHLGHMHFAPEAANEAVDKWHHDTLPLDYVMMVTDPASIHGGAFEYFAGTKSAAAEFAKRGLAPPRDRVVVRHFGGPGYAIALHGDMVVHRAAPLTQQGERITLVNGYVSLDPTCDDQSRCADLIGVDYENCLWTEWVKFAAWRSSGQLQHLIDTL